MPPPIQVLGLDIGTSSARAILYDGSAVPVAGVEDHITYVPDVTPDGGVTLDAQRLLDSVVHVIDQAEAQIRARALKPAAVGTSCFWHSLLLLDGAIPLSSLLLWADTRASRAAAQLSRSTDVTVLHARTGAAIHSSYWPAKLIWLAESRAELIAKASSYASFAEFLFLRLFGHLAVSTSMASGTGLLNVRSCAWDNLALSLAPPGTVGKLSPIDDGPLPELLPEWKARWPSLTSAQWFPAVGDGACSSVGSGGSAPHRFVVTVGTSAAVRAVIRQPSEAEGGGGPPLPSPLWNYRLDAGRGVVGGALSEGGNLVAWLERTLRLPPLEQAESELATREPDATGLTVLPFIAGQRSPDWIGNARATLSGISLDTTPVDILQAVLESVAYQIELVFLALVDFVGTPDLVICAGAALARSPVWTQIIAGVLGRSVALSPYVESSSRGAAMLALERLGRSLEDLEAPLGHSFDPGGALERYHSGRARQSELYRRLILGSTESQDG